MTILIILAVAFVLFGIVSISVMIKQSNTEDPELDEMGENLIRHHIMVQRNYLENNKES